MSSKVGFVERLWLAPKCYSFSLLDDPVPKQACKGVSKGKLSHQDYKDRYESKTELARKVRRMQSFKHIIFNMKQLKIALSFFENKRAWVSDNESYPYGHYKVTPIQPVRHVCSTPLYLYPANSSPPCTYPAFLTALYILRLF